MSEEQVERNIERAFDLAHEIIDTPEAFPDEFVAIPLEDDILLKILTKERIKLLRTVRDDGPFESLTELAEALGRDTSRISRDIQWLAEAGLVNLEPHGRSKRVRGTDRRIILT